MFITECDKGKMGRNCQQSLSLSDPSKSNDNNIAVIGGAAGAGLLVVIIICILVFILWVFMV